MPRAKDPAVNVINYFETAHPSEARLTLALSKRALDKREGHTKAPSTRGSGKKKEVATSATSAAE